MRDMAHSICLIKLYQITMRKNFDFLFLTTLIEKASQIYVLVIFISFSLNVTLFNWHKVNNVTQILISNIKLALEPKRSSLFKSF